MNVQTLIEIYDNDSGNFVADIDITKYGLDSIRKIAPPKADDPDYYDPFDLNKDQFLLLQNLVPELTDYIYEENFYCIQSRQAEHQ